MSRAWNRGGGGRGGGAARAAQCGRGARVPRQNRSRGERGAGSARARASIQLTYDEAVEPRLAIISVTDEQGRQETTGSVHRSPANPDTLVVPLRAHLPEGWYLIYWRAISASTGTRCRAPSPTRWAEPGAGPAVSGSEHLREPRPPRSC